MQFRYLELETRGPWINSRQLTVVTGLAVSFKNKVLAHHPSFLPLNVSKEEAQATFQY